MREKKRRAEGARACLWRVLRLGPAVALALAGCGDLPLVGTLQRESPGELRFSPADPVVPTGSVLTFTVMGGISPYHLVSGAVTSLGNNTWQFTAPAAISGNSQDFPIQFSDWAGTTAESIVRVYSGAGPQLKVSEITLPAGDAWTFEVVPGTGVAPYAWEVDGVIKATGSSGTYTFSSAVTGAYAVAVIDSAGVSQVAIVTVVTNSLGDPLTITPTSAVMLPGGAVAYTALGGSGFYTFSAPDGGSIDNANPATFTAPGSAGTYAVTVTDYGPDPPVTVSAEAVVTATGTILVLSPSGATVSAVGDRVQFSASGGSPPYAYSVNKPAGSIDAATGAYLQLDGASVVVTVEDSSGLTDNTLVKWKP